MSRTPPREIQLPPRPSQLDILGDTSALTSDSAATSPSYQLTPSGHAAGGSGRNYNGLGLGNGTGPRGHGQRTRSTIRPSFSTVRSRKASRAATTAGIDELVCEQVGAPQLPTLVPGIRPAYSTPLPTLPMVVLCIAMLSELLSANLSTPFLLKMVEGFYLSAGNEKTSETEAQVGLWAGNLVSVFFITQFATSLLWSSIADRHGRRAVLVASLAGSALAVMTFGTSQSLPEAICVRLVQGIFGGAVGVFRGSIRDITDETNATRAYAILGFSWGFGGVAGPILGGVFESPAENFPNSFLGHIELFQTNPYLPPTLVAGAILLVGAGMACFLSWDGGVRGGSRIELSVEKNEPLAGSERRARSVSPLVERHDPHEDSSQERPPPSPTGSHLTAVPTLRHKRSDLLSPGGGGGAGGAEEAHMGTPASFAARRDSRASLGTAYGYGGIRSKHPTLAARAAVEAARRVSHAAGPSNVEDENAEEAPAGLGLAKKLLLANEENTFNLNDIWVSAVIEQEQAVFEDEDDDEDAEGEEDQNDEADYDRDSMLSPGYSPALTAPGSTNRRVSAQRSRLTSSTYRPMQHRQSVSGGPASGTSGRRFSTASGHLPAIFANTGLQTPPAIAAAYEEYSPMVRGTPRTEESDPFFSSPAAGTGAQRPMGGLSVISEGGTGTAGRSRTVSAATMGNSAEVSEKKPSVWGALPFLIISQYGLLALHNTVHDQIFLSFLVSPYTSGGLGLPPAKFSFLIALMCIFQLIYQFWLYPRLGPPLGKFSHLQMFRLGCALYIPAYLALPLLHSVTNPENPGGFVTMTLLTIITAVRYCGGTLGYTSIMVLINAMSPPHVVGLANGLAQSTVSLARFVGPVIGGTIWSTSIAGNPAGYFKPFVMVTIGCAIQWSLSFVIR